MLVDLFILQASMLKIISESIDEQEEKINDILYKFYGVKAIRYDKVPTGFNSNIAAEMRERMEEELKEPEAELDRLNKKHKDLENRFTNELEQLPSDMQRAAVDLFLKGKTYEEVGKDIGYSPGGLWVKIRREIQKINDKL